MIAEEAQHTPYEKVRVLQRKLYLSAKEKKEKKYGILYDKVCRYDVLLMAWEMVRKNKGAPGIDGQTVDYIHNELTPEFFIAELQRELKLKTYRPQPVKRVYIPKADGKQRPLGIPVIKDRVVQAAVKIVIEPIFEADFHDCSYGFRPKRNPLQAVQMVRRHVVRGHRKIVDLDLKTYFDTIPHDKLLALVKQRVRDPSILWLIRRWLKAGIMEQGTFYSSETGSPQGGVISPLLANIYLNAFDQIWHKSGLADGEHQAKLVRFADDSVICCRRNPEKYADAMRQIMQRLGLTVNEEKTKIVDAADGFDFLGMHFRWKKAKNRKMWCFIWPSQKSMKRIRQRIRDKLNIDDRIPVSEIAMHINPVLRGWCNYFRYSNAAEHFVKVDRFVQTRVKRLLRRKRQKRGRCNRDYHASFYRRIGLFFLSGNVKRLPL